MKLSELLGDPTWLFDLGFPIAFVKKSKPFVKPENLEWELDDAFRIPALSSLVEEKRFAEVSVGWNDDGIFLHASIRKPEIKMPPRADRTIHMTLYLDTRWSPGVHRGTSFCHRFDFFCEPNESSEIVKGHGELGIVQRSRATPGPIHPQDISVGLLARSFGYELKAFLRADTLTGFDPREYQEIGLFYVIQSQFLGSQCIARSKSSPYFEDPSVWCRCKVIQPVGP